MAGERRRDCAGQGGVVIVEAGPGDEATEYVRHVDQYWLRSPRSAPAIEYLANTVVPCGTLSGAPTLEHLYGVSA